MSSKTHHPQYPHNPEAFELELARGNIRNCELFGAFGEVVLAGATNNWIVWPGPTQFHPYSPTGVAGTIQSSSANDTAAGTGVQRVEIHYLDAAGDEKAWATDLSGVTPIALPENFRFIQCIHSDRNGTGLVAAGNITITAGGVVYSYVAAGNTRCTSASRVVPRGKRLIIRTLVGGSVSGSAAAQAKVALVATQLAGHQYSDDTNIIYIRHNQVAVQDSSESLGGLYLPFDELTIVSMMCSTDKGATITASWGGWIEDK